MFYVLAVWPIHISHVHVHVIANVVRIYVHVPCTSYMYIHVGTCTCYACMNIVYTCIFGGYIGTFIVKTSYAHSVCISKYQSL